MFVNLCRVQFEKNIREVVNCETHEIINFRRKLLKCSKIIICELVVRDERFLPASGGQEIVTAPSGKPFLAMATHDEKIQ